MSDKDADQQKSEDKKDVKKPVAVKRPPFSVAKGKAITSKRGILSNGAEVSAEDLGGGKTALDALVKSGHIVKA
jgi:hypothetical protein